MKKTIITMLTVVFMLMAPNSSSAVELKGGFKIGVNFADFYGADMKEIEEELGGKFEAKLGLCVGGFITFNLSDIIVIQPEVLFSMKGSKAEGTLFNETLKLQFNLHYWEIPVLVKLQIPTQGNVKPNLFVGPCVAIKLSG